MIAFKEIIKINYHLSSLPHHKTSEQKPDNFNKTEPRLFSKNNMHDTYNTNYEKIHKQIEIDFKIKLSNTAPQPFAMMIHLIYADVTSSAMIITWWFLFHTYFTYIFILFYIPLLIGITCLFLLWRWVKVFELAVFLWFCWVVNYQKGYIDCMKTWKVKLHP